ncbi:uncharacterized protein CPUR_07212 [Claviceps purpurea 20.1]|uniref:Uncharacterized protein n=1 Tax=Claviceps purpurea (strain 20.1) TaxID=1111077 RepID=M1WF18_CLAP2|nr:uncharacterized protein CPUR_07212 [Claviceps purpurea 20.1]
MVASTTSPPSCIQENQAEGSVVTKNTGRFSTSMCHCQAQKAVQEKNSPLLPEMDPTPMQGRETLKQSLSDSVPATCSSCSRPSLQNLPVELLEKIFLYSMNLALPRSSPLLGAKLSAKVTRRRVIMTAFHENWDWTLGKGEVKSHSEKDKEEVNLPVLPESEKCSEFDAEKFKKEASLQYALLSMPWANIDFILDVEQAWARKHARGRCFKRHNNWGGRFSPGEHASYAPESYHQHILQHSLGELTFDARACFEADYARALAHRIPPGSFSVGTVSEMPELTPPVVPVDLITGPWNEEQKRRLFWLARANLDQYVDPLYLGSRPVEVKLACLDAAVISAEVLDPLIVNCLMGPWLFEDLPRDAEHERLLKLVDRIDRGGEELDMDILRFVVTQLDRDCRFLEYHCSSETEYESESDWEDDVQ